MAACLAVGPVGAGKEEGKKTNEENMAVDYWFWANSNNWIGVPVGLEFLAHPGYANELD
jgi:hypothetical protein